MKVLQLNSSVNFGSTGRIAEDLGNLLILNDHQSYIAYGRKANESLNNLLRIGNKFDIVLHVLKSRIFDLHGFGSGGATRKLVKTIDNLKPDIIHLHNVHGYYLNIKILFDYIKGSNIPVVWTFHDCWPFTGHCSYFDAVGCFKWQEECNNCPNLKGYPKSWFTDNSKNNYYQKKSLFTNLENLTIVTPSKWLARHIEKSFLNEFPVKVINNGIDLASFKPLQSNVIYKKYKISNGKYILGVANIWDKRKGLDDFIELRKLIPAEISIVLVGLSPNQIKNLPYGISGITRTESKTDMAILYSCATAFINPTYVDNFPSTNIEAMACGTPVITYNTGGSPESIDKNTGVVVEKGDLHGLVKAINIVFQKGKEFYSSSCRKRTEQFFNKDARANDYITLYQSVRNAYSCRTY